MVRSRKQVSSKCSLRGSGTPHFTYDRVNEVYRYKLGGSMFGALKKSVAKVGAKVIKAAKPLGKNNGGKRNESSYKSEKSKINYEDGVFERGFIG